MTDRWLTIKNAAARVGVSPRTVRRYIERDGLVVLAGRVRESQLLEVEASARSRMMAGRFAERTKSDLRKLADAYCAGLDEAVARAVQQFVRHAEASYP